MWNEYKNSDAVFAIGSPTVELFMASFNNRSNKSTEIGLRVESNGYCSEGGFELSVDDNHGIYNRNSGNWWIASPCYEDGVKLLGVQGGTKTIVYGHVSFISVSIRPVVCIPTSIFDNKYKLENT